MDEDQQWENNSLSDNLTTNNNNNSQSDETERKITHIRRHCELSISKQ